MADRGSCYGHSPSGDGSGRDVSRHGTKMSYAPFGERRGRERPSEGQGTAVAVGASRESRDAERRVHHMWIGARLHTQYEQKSTVLFFFFFSN